MNVDETLVKLYYVHDTNIINELYDHLKSIGYETIYHYYKYEYDIDIENILVNEFISILKDNIRKDKLRNLLK